MTALKKAGRFISSMRFAMILLIVLIVSCIVGSVISQGQTYAWYASHYSERTAGAILALHLDDVFHSWWFLLITAFLCINLLLCNLIRLPRILKKWKRSGTYEEITGGPVSVSAHVAELTDDLFHRMGFHKVETHVGFSDQADKKTRAGSSVLSENSSLSENSTLSENSPLSENSSLSENSTLSENSSLSGGDMTSGNIEASSGRISLAGEIINKANTEARECRYSVKGRLGIWGAWVCHLGILLLILGFGLGQSLKEEYTVYGVPGQSKEIGNTGYILTIDDFRTELREDGSAAQYTADLTVRNPSNDSMEEGSASVNSPAALFGMKFYQNSTGWAAAIRILENGEELQSGVLCGGDFVPVKDKPDLVIYLNAVYPDYVFVEGKPMSLGNEVKNPAYLYSVYYQGSVLGMNVLMDGEPLTIDEYTVYFSDPQPYTLLQVKRDPFTPLAFLGGLVTLLGLILALYIQPVAMWAIEEPDGSWILKGYSRKGGAIFTEQFREVVGGKTLPEDSDQEESGNDTATAQSITAEQSVDKSEAENT